MSTRRTLPVGTLRHVVVLLLSLVLAALPGAGGPDGAGPPGAARRAPGATGLVVSQVLGVREGLAADRARTRARPALPDAARDRSRTAQWGWPLVGAPPVARAFDPPVQRWLPGHRGVDLAGVAGEQVLAVDGGVVTFSGTLAGVGVVSVTHPSGLRSTYQPVAERAPRGQRVGRGQPVGVLGSTGSHCGLADCLHLGAVRGRGEYVDPLPLLLGTELALLPVPP